MQPQELGAKWVNPEQNIHVYTCALRSITAARGEGLGFSGCSQAPSGQARELAGIGTPPNLRIVMEMEQRPEGQRWKTPWSRQSCRQQKPWAAGAPQLRGLQWATRGGPPAPQSPQHRPSPAARCRDKPEWHRYPPQPPGPSSHLDEEAAILLLRHHHHRVVELLVEVHVAMGPLGGLAGGKAHAPTLCLAACTGKRGQSPGITLCPPGTHPLHPQLCVPPESPGVDRDWSMEGLSQFPALSFQKHPVPWAGEGAHGHR